MIRGLLKLISLPFTLAFGLVKLGFNLLFGLFQGVFGIVFGVLGLVLGLFKGLFGLIVLGAIIALIAGMFNRGYRSGSRTQRSSADMFDDFCKTFRQSVR